MPRDLETERFSAHKYDLVPRDLVPTNTIWCLKTTIWCLQDFVPGDLVPINTI